MNPPRNKRGKAAFGSMVFPYRQYNIISPIEKYAFHLSGVVVRPKEFDFGKLTNQYTFHTEKALKYLKEVGVMYDKPTAGND